MELESLPIFGLALAVSLAAPITVFGGRPIDGGRLVRKRLEAVFFPSRSCLSFSGAEGEEAGAVFFAAFSRPSMAVASRDEARTMAPGSSIRDLSAA